MTLPASGPISFSQIAVELGRASTASVSLHDPAVYGLAGKTAGAAISLSDFYGKTKPATSVAVSISPNTVNISKATTGTGLVDSGTVTATASSGTGTGYTYSWALVAGSSSGLAISITNPSAAATNFRVSSATNGSLNSATFRCTVTDSGANTGTADIYVELDGYPF